MNQIKLRLYHTLRNIFKSQVAAYKEIFNQKLFPNFENISNEAEKYAEDFYQQLCSQSYDDHDDYYVAEKAFQKGFEHYQDLYLFQYVFTANSITNLYHFWEQQVRYFLYSELKFDFKIKFTKFCEKGIKDLKNLLSAFNINVENFSSWSLLNELRILANVIKHGDGHSATELNKINPTLFRSEIKMYSGDLILHTTLFEENLNINQDLFNDYANNILKFWDEFPEMTFLDGRETG